MTIYTKDNAGFVPVTDLPSELAYYKAFISWAKEQFDFEPDYDNEDYPKFLADNPMVEFPEPDEFLYADFVATWDYVNQYHTGEGVVFNFNDNGELELVDSTKED